MEQKLLSILIAHQKKILSKNIFIFLNIIKYM